MTGDRINRFLIILLLMTLLDLSLSSFQLVTASTVFRGIRQAEDDQVASTSLPKNLNEEDTQTKTLLEDFPEDIQEEVISEEDEANEINEATDSIATSEETEDTDLTVALFEADAEPIEEEETTTTELAYFNVTEEVTSTAAPVMKATEPVCHPCVIDVDESEPEFQRYVCTGNSVVSLICTTFLLSMICFAVIKNISAWGLMNLVDIRRSGVSFPQRPEIIVLICSTLPTIFTTIVRPLFFPYEPMYARFIGELRCMQARQFFDLFSRTTAVYHMIYWAYRMPLIRWLWRNYLRFNAFRAVWTKEHIIEVLHDKFAPEKDDKFLRMFGNSPEYMIYYAQFLQSGLPMQYLQTLMKPASISPSMSTAALDGMLGPNQTGKMGTGDGGGVLPRVNLGQLMAVGSDGSTSPKAGQHSNFLGAPGAAGSTARHSTSPLLMPPSGSHQISRNTSFRSSHYGGARPPHSPDAAFGQHLTSENAGMMLQNLIALERQASGSRELLPTFSSTEMLIPGHGAIPGMEFLSPNDKQAKEEEILVKPPTREFVYICKHALPGVIYIVSFFATLPSIFGFDVYQYESRITTTYFYYDFVFIVVIPMLAIIAAFYYGALAKTQLNGESKMHFRLKCYYVNFLILNLPILFLMVTATAYRITLSREVDTPMYGTGIIIALTAYHAQFILKTTVYTTGCNCICCSESCLYRHPRINRCIICMVTPRNPPTLPAGTKTEGGVEEGVTVDSEKAGGGGGGGGEGGKKGKEVKIITQPETFGKGTEIQIHPQEQADVDLDEDNDEKYNYS